MANNHKKPYISIRIKIFTFVIAVLLLFPMLLIGSGYYFTDLSYKQKITDKVNESSSITETLINSDSKMLASVSEVVSSNTDVVDSFLAGDRDTLYAITDSFFQNLKSKNGITHLYFIDTEGKIFLRTHDKEKFGDTISRKTFQASKKLQQRVEGIELGKTGFALRSVSPWYVENKLIGYIEVGEEINHLLFVLKENNQGHYEAFGDKQYLNETDWSTLKNKQKIDEEWDLYKNFAVVGETVGSEVLDNCISKDTVLTEALNVNYKTFTDNSVEYSCSELPLKTLDNKVIGSIHFAIDVTDIAVAADISYKMLALTSVLLFLVLLLCSYIYIRRALVSPINRLTDEVVAITKTLDFDRDVTISSNDELGNLGESFNLLKNKLKDLQIGLEERVRERTYDLEKVNHSMVGRELKMIELKKKIKELKSETDKRK